MLKTYELAERHFGWTTRPRPATERQIVEYLLDRALRALVHVAAQHGDRRRRLAVLRDVPRARRRGSAG